MDDGLMGVVAKLPLERNFKLEHVKEARALSASSASPPQMLMGPYKYGAMGGIWLLRVGLPECMLSTSRKAAKRLAFSVVERLS